MALDNNEEQIVFKVDPDPTFWATVEIPMIGGKVGKLEVEFKFKDRDAYSEFFTVNDGKKDIEALPEIVVGWRGADAPYSVEALGRLLRNYPLSGAAFIKTYRDSIWGALEKN